MTSVIQQVTVDSNTSVVLLNTQSLLDNNDIVVLLSTTTLPGRIVSIRDTTGNLSATRRIVVSTMMGTQFFGGVSSYTLTQPFAFVTVANRDPTTWVLQNTFAFPAPTTVASVLGVTAGFMIVSSIQAQTVFSTTVMQVSSLNVENVVAKNDVTNAGNLYVGATQARFGTKGNANFTGNVSVVSTLSTGLDIVVGQSLNVLSSMNVGGSTFMHGSLSTLGTLYARSSLTVDGPSYMSSLSTSGLVGFGGDLYMTNNTAYISSISAASFLVDTFTALSNTTLTNLSTLGPRIGFGADVYLTQNTLFDSSTFSKYVGASTIGAVSTTTSSLNVYATTRLSTVSTTGTAAFVGTVYLQNDLVGPNIATSTVEATNAMKTSSMFTSSLTVPGLTNLSNLSTVGNIGFGSDVYMTSNTLRSQRVLVSSLTVSDELITKIFTAANLTTQNTLLVGDTTTAYTKITSTLVSTTQLQSLTGDIFQLVVSSIRGDGSDLYNLNAISSATLQSTLAGLGTYGYISVITANPINQGQMASTIIGLGTFGYISSFASGVINPIDIQRGVSTLNLFANNISFSNTLSANFLLAAPNPAFAMTSVTGPIYAQWQSGPNNQILFGVDGTGNAIVRSQFPGAVLQPLNLYGSQLTNVTSEFQVSETGPNNVPLTRIYNSNMSTGTIYADTLELNQWRGPAAGLYSTGLSTLGLFTSNTASNVSSLHAITSSGFSTLGLFTSNTASNVSSLHGIVSSGFSTLGLFTSNTASNVSSLHGITSSGFSTLGLFTSNTASNVSSLHGIVSSGFSTLGLFTSNTASNVSSLHGITSSGFSTLGLFTSNTSNFFKTANIDWSTPLSTVALFTSNTASNVSSLHGIVSSGFSTLGLFTSNTASNVSSLHGIVSSGFSTLGLFTSNTASNVSSLHGITSSGFSTLGLFTSNTSNFFKTTNIDWSTPLSTVALFTSNTASNVSSLHGITSSGFSTLGLFTSNTASNVSSLHGITSSGFSTLGLFTSNTSNWASNSLQDWSTSVSSVGKFGSNSSNYTVNTSNYMFNILQNWSTPVSTATLFTSNTSNYLLNLVNNPPNTTGTVLYLNYSVTVGSYKGLQINSTEASATTLPITVDGNTNNTPVAQFQTDFTLPTFINGGFWDLNLFATSSDATNVSVYAILYKRTGLTELQIATSFAVPDVVGVTLTQVIPNLFLQYTDIAAGDSLVLKIFAINTGSPQQTLTVYFEGGTYSHMHTTLGTLVAIDALTSTTNGLGTAGYTSTGKINDLSNYYYNLLQNWSTSLSSVAQFSSNISGAASAGSTDWSTSVSSVGRFTSNVLQNWSTPVSSVATFGSNTSNYMANILQNWSTPVSSVGTFSSNASNYMANILQNWSTPVSSVGTFGSNTSNYMANILQNWSTPVSSVGTFSSNASNYTVNTSNYLRGSLQDWSTPVSSVGTFSSNASNYTVNTSNYLRGVLQDWSTPVSSVGTFSSNASNYTVNSSNYLRGVLQDWSTPVSSVGTFSSNASNYTVNTSNYLRGALQDWSTPVSTVARFTSNVATATAGTDWSTSVSTVAKFTSNVFQNWSTPLSTVATFTSNTSNYASNYMQDWSTSFSTMKLVTSSLGINTNTAKYTLDVNGPSRGAIIYSTNTAATPTIYPNEYYGVYYNLTGGGGALTVNLSLTNALTTSNYGKYVVFRNNSAADATVTFAGAVSGVTPPAGTTLYSNTSMTVVVASNVNTATGSFVLF